MRKNHKFILILFTLVFLLMPQKAFAAGLSDDRVVFGGTFTLESEDILDGDLMVIGGAATLEQNSSVNGSVVLLGGNVEAKGDVLGDVIGIGGLIELTDTAHIRGAVIILGSNLDRAEGTQVDGDIIFSPSSPLSLNIPGKFKFPHFQFGFDPIIKLIWFVLRIFIWAALAMFVVMFFPKHIDRVREVVLAQPVIAGGLGILTAMITPPILVLTTITIIFIPVSILGALLLAIAWFIGIVAVGLETGKRFAGLVNQDWPDAINAGLGTLFLVFVMNSLSAIVPCVGLILPAIVIVIGVGAVLITRFGTRDYVGYKKPNDGELPEPPEPLTSPEPPKPP